MRLQTLRDRHSPGWGFTTYRRTPLDRLFLRLLTAVDRTRMGDCYHQRGGSVLNTLPEDLRNRVEAVVKVRGSGADCADAFRRSVLRYVLWSEEHHDLCRGMNVMRYLLALPVDTPDYYTRSPEVTG